MKTLIFSGTHSRHLFVHQAVMEQCNVVGVVCMQRESQSPKPDSDCDPEYQRLFCRHFDERTRVESETYGALDTRLFDDVPRKLFVQPNELNSEKTADFVSEINAEACFIFGVDLILDPVIGFLPKWKINLHLGFSPWYRGSATLFWPFYFLQPQFAGATFHQIVPEADAGDIIHHSMPELKLGQGIHDVGAEVVLKAREDLRQLLDRLSKDGGLPLSKQKSTGRLFLTRDFEPQHLRPIYDLYDDKIVDAWLNGRLGSRTPKLVNGLR